jgi:hypothetical protein
MQAVWLEPAETIATRVPGRKPPRPGTTLSTTFLGALTIGSPWPFSSYSVITACSRRTGHELSWSEPKMKWAET